MTHAHARNQCALANRNGVDLWHTKLSVFITPLCAQLHSARSDVAILSIADHHDDDDDDDRHFFVHSNGAVQCALACAQIQQS